MIEFNTCRICGANGGRAGLLIGNDDPDKNRPFACLNCHDTRTTGIITIHSNLIRTDEEIQKTFNILENGKK